MGKLFRPLILSLATIVMVASGAMFTNCTDVDDALGGGLVPPVQKMKFGTYVMDQNGIIDSYIGMQDSIPSNNMNLMWIGSMKNETFGILKSGFIGQYNYVYTEIMDMYPKKTGDKEPEKSWATITAEKLKAGLFYGYNAKDHIVDATLEVMISTVYGDSNVEQEFYIYELSESIGPKYTYKEKYPGKGNSFKKKMMLPYYPMFDPQTAIGAGAAPLFSFKLQNVEKGKKSIKLTILPEGEKFLKKMVALEEITIPEKPDPKESDKKRGVMYNDDDIFRQHLKGFYITVADPTVHGAIYELNISQDIGTISTFSVKALCDRELDQTDDKRDSVLVYYSFEDGVANSYLPNTSIGVFQHTYTDSEVDESLFWNSDEGAVNQQTNKLYIQGLFGVSSYIELNDKFIEQIKGLMTDEDGQEWGVMKINRAVMKIKLDQPDVPSLDYAPVRLGMYRKMRAYAPFTFPTIPTLIDTKDDDGNELGSAYFMPIAITDYLYRYEAGITDAYGGYINRSEGHGYYKMYITSYLSELINQTPEQKEDREETEKDLGMSKGIWLAPAFTSVTADNSVNNYAYLTPKGAVLRNDSPSENGAGGAVDIKQIEIEIAYTLMNPKGAK